MPLRLQLEVSILKAAQRAHRATGRRSDRVTIVYAVQLALRGTEDGGAVRWPYALSMSRNWVRSTAVTLNAPLKTSYRKKWPAMIAPDLEAMCAPPSPASHVPAGAALINQRAHS